MQEKMRSSSTQSSNSLAGDQSERSFVTDVGPPCDPAFAPPSSKAVRRLLVVDGCNIARSSCGPTRDNVNCAGLMAVIRWLLVRRFEVVAFLPIIYNNSCNFNATNVYLLQKLEELGVVTFTPARTARGDRRAFINYDDLYVASLAARHGGTVLSGDRFKDIIAQQQYSELHDVLRNRRIDVHFYRLKQPYAQIGEDRFVDRVPELFLRPQDATSDPIMNRLWADQNDPNFEKVVLRRKSWSEVQSNRIIATIDLLMDELCERAAVRPISLPPPVRQWILYDGNKSRENPSSSTSPTQLSVTSRNSSYSLASSNGDRLSEESQLASSEWVTDDGYSNIVPGLWIPPGLRHISHEHLLPDTCSETQQLEDNTVIEVDSSLVFSPPSWKDVDLLKLNVTDLHYCLHHPRQDQLTLPSLQTQNLSSEGSVDDLLLAQLIDAFPLHIARKVLKDNVSRNLEVLANLCAELTAF